MPDLANRPAPVAPTRTLETALRSLKVMEATTDVVAMMDRTGRLLYLNNTARRLIGLDPGRPLGMRTLAELQPAWAFEVVAQEGLPGAIEAGSWSGETAILSANGTEMPVLQVVLSHENEDGEVEFLSTICRDITDRKLKELEGIEWANRYDAAIRASGQVVFDWDTADGAVTYGGNVASLFGFSVQEMEGGIQRLRELVRPGDLDDLDAAITNATSSHEPLRHEFRAITRDGAEVTVELQGCFFLDRRGRSRRMVGFFTDVTAQRIADRTIQQANELLEQRVQERTVELQRANRELQDSARRQEALAGLGQRALGGLSLDELMREAVTMVLKMMPVDCALLLKYDDGRNILECAADAGWAAPIPRESIPAGNESQGGFTMIAGAPVTVPELAAEKRFGIPDWLLKSGAKSGLSVCVMAGTQTFGVLSVYSRTRREFSDQDVNFVQTITNVLTSAIERHGAEASIRRARSEAETANRAKSEFLSRMSHELRTPLNAILGFTQLLEMDERTERQAESISHISRAGRNLLDLINEVLDIARLDAGRIQFQIEPFEVMELLRDAVNAAGAVAGKRNVKIEIAESSGAVPVVSADRSRMRQVLANLLSNGVQFNHTGGTVTLSVARPSARTWRINVTDTGIGIPKEKLARLFVPFERLGTHEGGVAGGTGLGLALCRGLVNGLGGRIGVISTPGQGSTFWIDLPAAEAPPQYVPAPAPPPPPCVRDAKRTILYIEDDVSNFYVLARMLAPRKEVTVHSAIQGDLGIKHAREHHPDLILLDMNLPDMTGEQVLRALKNDPTTAGIRVVAISGELLTHRQKELAELGVADTLLKPYRFAELTAVLERSFKAVA